jgi:predicted transcriptional regulator
VAILSVVEVVKVKDIMVRDVVTVKSNTCVSEAVKMMTQKGIGCLLVVDEGETRGIVTQLDLLAKVLEKCRDPKQLKVADIMSKHIVTGEPEMEVHQAANLMFKKKVKKLPIIQQKRIVGLVTLTNIARTVGVDSELMDIVEKLSNMRAI